jgi:hypothetical protein
MLESRPHSSTVFVLLIMLAVILGGYLYRSDIQPRQIWQKISRFAVGQEIIFRTAQFQEMQTEHFRIKYTQADDDYVSIIADSAELAYSQVSNKMNTNGKQKTTIVVYPDSQSLAQCFGWDKNEKALGVYWAGTIRILSPHEWLKHEYNEDEFQTEGPLVHEYVHLIVDDMTGGNYNRWWTEGVAQYVEKRITGFQFEDPQDVTAGQLYTFQELDKNFDELDQQMSYWESRQAVEFIASQYGEEKIYMVMDHLAQGDRLYRAIEKATGIDFEDFAYQCYRYMEKQ